MLLHVFEGVFISIQKLEFLIVEAESSSDIQILSCEVLRRFALKQLLAWLLDMATCQKLTTKHTWWTMCEKDEGRIKEGSFFISLIMKKH